MRVLTCVCVRAVADPGFVNKEDKLNSNPKQSYISFEPSMNQGKKERKSERHGVDRPTDVQYCAMGLI